MNTTPRLPLVGCTIAAVLILSTWAGAEAEPLHTARSHLHRHHRAPGGRGVYKVNRYGYGRYVHGRNGSYGGYPAGSAGSRELQINRELQCRSNPEQC